MVRMAVARAALLEAQHTIDVPVEHSALVVGGGVVANNYFRDMINGEAKERGIKVFIAKNNFCTDNASMIAGLGYQLYRLGKRDNINFKPLLY